MGRPRAPPRRQKGGLHTWFSFTGVFPAQPVILAHRSEAGPGRETKPYSRQVSLYFKVFRRVLLLTIPYVPYSPGFP